MPASANGIERFRLPNGLDVVLEEAHDTPRIASFLRYHVGSRDQPRSYQGLAHMLEHLMFEQSLHSTGPFVPTAEALGASQINGVTSADSTDYYQVFPSNQLAPILWMESERMGYLLSRLDQQTLDAQRRVVVSEYRERVQNGPAGRFRGFVLDAFYPLGHPYRELDEELEDLNALSLSDVRWFFQQWYSPNNATLVLVGDFSTERARAMVEQYFGPLVSRGPVPRRAVGTAVRFNAERTVVVDAPVYSEVVELRWSAPHYFAEGDAALEVLGDYLEEVLHRRMVRQLDVAQLVEAQLEHRALASEFVLRAEAAEDHRSDELLLELDRGLDALRRAPIAETTVAALRERRNTRLRRVGETLLGRAGRLVEYAALTPEVPALLERDQARYRALTPEVLWQAAQNFLSRDRRLVAILRRSRTAPAEGAVATIDATTTTTRSLHSFQKPVSCLQTEQPQEIPRESTLYSGAGLGRAHASEKRTGKHAKNYRGVYPTRCDRALDGSVETGSFLKQGFSLRKTSTTGDEENRLRTEAPPGAGA